MKIRSLTLLSCVLAVISTEGDVIAQGSIRRVGDERLAYTTDASLTNFSPDQILVKIDGEGSLLHSSPWYFMRVADGMVSDFEFGLRDSKGIVPVNFLRQGRLIFIQPIPPNQFRPILFAVLNDSPDSQGTYSIKWIIDGLRAAREIGLEKLHPARRDYSLLLPALAEAIFSDRLHADRIPSNLTGDLHIPSVRNTIVTEKSVDMPLSIHDRPRSPFRIRLLRGLLPAVTPVLVAGVGHSFWPYLAVSAAVLPFSLARFTFRTGEKEEGHTLASATAFYWGILSASSAYGCAVILNALGH